MPLLLYNSVFVYAMTTLDNKLPQGSNIRCSSTDTPSQWWTCLPFPYTERTNATLCEKGVCGFVVGVSECGFVFSHPVPRTKFWDILKM